MSDTPRSDVLPDCMMPDGAEPCLGYRKAVQELEAVKRMRDFWHSAYLESRETRKVGRVGETPRTDAVQGGLEYATELPEDWEKCFQWMAGHARSLERELANAFKAYQACNDDLIKLSDEHDKLNDQLMRWFKAASPYATPGSLEEGLKKMERELAEAQNVMSDLPKEHMGEYERMEEYRRQKEMPSKEVLDAITQGRETGFALGLREAAEVAEHYAKLMNSEAAQRAADEIRAMLSEPNAAPADAAPIDSTVKPSAWD